MIHTGAGNEPSRNCTVPEEGPSISGTRIHYTVPFSRVQVRAGDGSSCAASGAVQYGAEYSVFTADLAHRSDFDTVM